MRFFSAGNFVLMSKYENEKKFKDLSDSVYGEDSYHRLTSFFYKKESKNILKVKKDGKKIK